MERGDQYRIFCQISSAVVIICFFLPWLGSDIGLRVALYFLENQNYGNQHIHSILVWFISPILYVLSPTVLHIISVIVVFRKGTAKTCFYLAIIPLAIWVLLTSYAYLMTRRFVPFIGGVGIGFYGTLIGQISAVVFSFLRFKPKFFFAAESEIGSSRNYRLFCQISSGVVILSFFLPWVKSDSGPGLVNMALKAFNLTKYSSDWAIIGIVGLLFVLSPIVLHALNVFATLRVGTKRISLNLVTAPLAIWILLFCYMSIKAGRMVVPLPSTGSIMGIGFYGTLIGQIAAVVSSIIRVKQESILEFRA